MHASLQIVGLPENLTLASKHLRSGVYDGKYERPNCDWKVTTGGKLPGTEDLEMDYVTR